MVKFCVAIAVISSHGCSTDPQPRRTAEDRTVDAEIGTLDTLVDRFPGRAGQIRSFLTEPASRGLPERAVSVYNFLEADQLDGETLIWDRPGGRFHGDYYLASASPREISVTVICLVNGSQRDCRKGASTSRVDLTSASYARFKLSLTLEEADRVEVLRVVGGETERFDPASGGLFFFAGRRGSLSAAQPVASHPKVLGGCDVTAFTSTDSRARNVLRSTSAGDRVFIVVEFCEEGDWTVRPIFVADGREVLPFAGEDPLRASKVSGRTFVAELPEIPRQVESLQAFVLVDPIRSFHVLVSPALKVG